MSLSTAGAESAPGRGLPRNGRACPTPVELVATAARRKRIKVMLSQVDGLLSFASLVLVREDRILEAVMVEISLSKRLGELVTLCEESIEVCALVRELLDESPVIGGSKINRVTTVRWHRVDSSLW
jgi:hypothetical protein